MFSKCDLPGDEALQGKHEPKDEDPKSNVAELNKHLFVATGPKSKEEQDGRQRKKT